MLFDELLHEAEMAFFNRLVGETLHVDAVFPAGVFCGDGVEHLVAAVGDGGAQDAFVMPPDGIDLH